MALKRVNSESLTSVANAIRTKGGTTEQLTFPAGFVSAINAIDGCNLPHYEIPQYVKDEALSVAEKVKAAQTDRTMTFICISDSHHPGEQNQSFDPHSNTGNLHAAMAAKIISYACNIDFCAYLGDYTFGNADTTKELFIQQAEQINGYLAESYNGLPQFRTVGNHDTGEYVMRETGDVNSLYGAELLYNLISSFCEGATYGSTEFGYCYRDFPNKKFRVICLNSCEGETIGGENNPWAISNEQKLWFAQTLYDVGSKADAADWSIISLAHYPLDYGGALETSRVLKAYVEGGSISILGQAINFSGHNAAKFTAHWHGHVHNFLSGKLHTIEDGNPVEYDAWRLCCPNSAFERNNYYVNPVKGISFHEDVTYNKTANSADDTSFVVNVINPDTQIIESFCYGAGIDRTVGYAATIFYRIDSYTTHCFIKNFVTSVKEGEPWESKVTPEDKYEMSSVTIMMGNTDISNCYSDGMIRIQSVTDNVVITAVATKIVTYHNLVPISVGTDGNIFNGVGYKKGTHIGSTGSESADNFCTVTGFIRMDGHYPHTIRVGGTVTGDKSSYPFAVCCYDQNFAWVTRFAGERMGTGGAWGDVVEESNTIVTWTPGQWNQINNPEGTPKYIRVEAHTSTADGSGIIVTVDEPID